MINADLEAVHFSIAYRCRDKDAIFPDNGTRMTQAGNGSLPLYVTGSRNVPRAWRLKALAYARRHRPAKLWPIHSSGFRRKGIGKERHADSQEEQGLREVP